MALGTAAAVSECPLSPLGRRGRCSAPPPHLLAPLHPSLSLCLPPSSSPLPLPSPLSCSRRRRGHAWMWAPAAEVSAWQGPGAGAGGWGRGWGRRPELCEAVRGPSLPFPSLPVFYLIYLSSLSFLLLLFFFPPKPNLLSTPRGAFPYRPGRAKCCGEGHAVCPPLPCHGARFLGR